MIITSITVRRLKTGNGYNNVAHEMTVAVDMAAGDDVEELRMQADLQVQAWNEQKTIEALRDEASNMEWNVRNLRSEKARLDAEIESLKRRVEQMKKTPLEDAINQQDSF